MRSISVLNGMRVSARGGRSGQVLNTRDDLYHLGRDVRGVTKVALAVIEALLGRRAQDHQEPLEEIVQIMAQPHRNESRSGESLQAMQAVLRRRTLGRIRRYVR